MVKLCHLCGELVPTSEWHPHLRRHRDAKSERKGGSRAWRRLVAIVKKRDEYKCVVCGSTESLEVDHINGNWRDNRLVNLRTVCFDHNPRGAPRRTST